MDFEESINNSDFEDDINLLESYANDIEESLDGAAAASASSSISKDEEDDIARAIEMSLIDQTSPTAAPAPAFKRKSTRPKFKTDAGEPFLPRQPRSASRNSRAKRRVPPSNSSAPPFNEVLNNIIAASAQQFGQQMKTFKFRTRPMEMLPDQYHANMYSKINQSSDKIIVPEKIMTNLYGSNNAVINDGVLVVEIRTYGSDNVKYATVSQYTEQDICYLPNLMFYGMLIEPDTMCHFRIVNNIARAKKVVLKPEIYEFMHIKDQMKLMFDEFNTNFRLLREEQQIIIQSEEVNKELTFNVEELYDENENRIKLGTIYDIDLEVEFKISAEFNQMYADEQAEKRRVKEAEERERRLRENPPMSNLRFKRPNINTFSDMKNAYNPNEKFNGDTTNLVPGQNSLPPEVSGIPKETEPFSGEGHTLGGRTDRLLSREELRRKRMQNLKFLGKGNKLGGK